MSARERLSDLLEPESSPHTPEARAARLRLSLQMADAGIQIMRQNLKRRHPGEPEPAIEERLAAWLQDRPGAEAGDAWGQPASERFPDL